MLNSSQHTSSRGFEVRQVFDESDQGGICAHQDTGNVMQERGAIGSGSWSLSLLQLQVLLADSQPSQLLADLR